MPPNDKLPLGEEFYDRILRLILHCYKRSVLNEDDRDLFLGVTGLCESEVERMLAKDRELPPHVRHGRPPKHRLPEVSVPQPRQGVGLETIEYALRRLLVSAYRKGATAGRDGHPILEQVVPSMAVRDHAVNSLARELLKVIKAETAAAVRARLDGREGGHA